MELLQRIVNSLSKGRFWLLRFNWDMSIDEAVELARRSIYHATFRDGASGGVVSGKHTSPFLSSRITQRISKDLSVQLSKLQNLIRDILGSQCIM